MFLGIDLGTSELKLLLLDDGHQVVGTASAPLTVQRPQPLWAEQSPDAWWAALVLAMGELQRSHGAALSQLQAVGLSGQMHGAVLLDGQGEVLRPAMLWNDGRSATQCEALSQAVPNLGQLSGNLAMPGFTAPKLMWVRDHEPEVFAQVRRVLLPKDWLRWRLTGEFVTDLSDASGTLWLDVGQRDWSDSLLAATGLTRAHMPRLVEGSERSGWLQPEWRARWGLPARVAVAGGAGDNAASAVGMGLVNPGQGFVSLGTSGVVFVCGDRFAPNPTQAVHAFCHALPGRWHQMSVMLSAASALDWAQRTLGHGSVADVLADAASLSPARQDAAPLFLPYLNGERSPHNNPHAQGGWVGLTMAHGRADLAYAVAEGVGFGLLDGLRTLNPLGQGGGAALGPTPASDQSPTPTPLPLPLPSLSLVGGGARSAWWSQWLAHTFNVRLTLHAGGETGAALGAARLAWLAVGGPLAAVCPVPPVVRSFEPDATVHARLMPRYARFLALYPALAPHFSPV